MNEWFTRLYTKMTTDDENFFSAHSGGLGHAHHYLAVLDGEHGGPHNVTFSPGCRNHWHVHHRSVQVLVCVAGRGWYQEWGKAAVELRPGKVIAIPAGVKHWHGAARDSWMQHLAYTTQVEEGARNEWLEPVDAAEYDKLN